jgi:hypothetical protein
MNTIDIIIAEFKKQGVSFEGPEGNKKLRRMTLQKQIKEKAKEYADKVFMMSGEESYKNIPQFLAGAVADRELIVKRLEE